jgi:hypothetical protein
MSFEEPIRFTSQASDAPCELASAIRAARQEQASPAQIAALAERLARVVATRPAPGSGSARWAWAVGISLLGAMTWLAATRLEGSDQRHPGGRSHAPAAETAPARAALRDRAADAASALPTAAASRTPSRIVSRHESDATVSERTHRALARAARAHRENHSRSLAREAPSTDLLRVQAGTSPSELGLLRRSQTALGNMPRRALALAEEHRRIYPNGVFAQEREVLAIEALFQLHQREAAIARATRFLAEHADSPHVRRVRSLLERAHAE